MTLRGLFAELQRQARRTAREHERARRADIREHNAAVRRAEQASKAAERAQVQLARAAAADRKRWEKESREAHVAAREAAVEERNLNLAEIFSEIDSLLATTLEVDDYFDLETLRVTAEHPQFDRPELEVPIPPSHSIPDPPQPIFVASNPPRGLLRLFGKKRYANSVATAQRAHEQALADWTKKCGHMRAHREEAAKAYVRAEADRLAELDAERIRYASECADREAKVSKRNEQLDELIANLSYGTLEAVQEYVSIVLSNSVYPDHFAVVHEYEFEPSSAELRLKAIVPGPNTIPTIKSYKYTRSTDKVTSTSLPQKICRNRYTSAVHQVALRSIHEVFESDRRGIIKAISLARIIHQETQERSASVC